MLQVRDLTKIYKTKGGVEVKALDNVSVTFPETGMVFLLGKSGSGKSTLLNVCGGLDSPTSGEIIVKGRSSKNFSQSDFDSYRNTYIGFIFQEYNILNEFSVENNIALALELQGKPKNKADIAQLLEDVDLAGYAKRKPNTLSGGQKQRIAIARALVKSPQIIMADEPTGALDSATGKQVFDTLKKLSQTKLVLVVSHDRDFAEQYGDRIIELKDGQIISDVTKTHEQQRAVSENVTFIGSTISVKNGANLTDKDFTEIKAFLKNVKGDVMIASGEKEVKDFRAVSRITDDGQKEIFRDTDESEIETKSYTAKERKFIRSRLPARHAFKIGVSGLKTKPVRLFFTILLCTVAFILFGLASTMTFYDSAATFKQSFMDSDIKTVRAVKEYREKYISYYMGEEESSWNNYQDAAFTAQEVKEFSTQFGADAFGAVYCHLSPSTQNTSNYYQSGAEYAATLPQGSSLRKDIIGRYPTANDEIMLTTYTATALKENKTYDNKGNPLTLQKIEDLIGQTLDFGEKDYKVVGLLPVEDLPSKFDDLRENGSSSDWTLMMELENTLNDSYRMVAFVTDNELQELAKRNTNDNHDYSYNNHPLYYTFEKNDSGNFVYPDDIYANGYYMSILSTNSEVTFLNKNATTLDDNQAIILAKHFFGYAYNAIMPYYEKAWEKFYEAEASWATGFENDFWAWQTAESEKENPDDFFFRYYSFYELYYAWQANYEGSIPDESHDLYPIYQNWLENVYPLLVPAKTLGSALYSAQALQNGYEYLDNKGDTTLTEARHKELVDILLPILRENDITFTCNMQLVNPQMGTTGLGERLTMEIVGVIDLYRVSDYSWYEQIFYVSDGLAETFWQQQKASLQYYSETTTKYTPLSDEIYSAVFLPYDHTATATDTLYSYYENRNILSERDTRVRLICSLTDTIEMVDNLILELSQIFLWAGVVMAAFAALLLSNFISVSISYKKRDIGILRAVGARGADVFKIFFSESFIITAICVAISLVGSIALCLVLNAEIGAGLGVSIFNFGIYSLATLLLIALLTAVLATFLPVWLTARKKPVESIRAL